MKFQCKIIIFLLFSSHLTFSGGMYQSYLIRVKSNARPFSPGDQRSNISRLKDQGNSALNSLESLLKTELPKQYSTNGPRSAVSPKVKSIEKFWFINSMKVICRFDFLEKIKAFPDVLEVVPDELVYLSTEDSGEELSFSQNEHVSQLHDQGITGKGVLVGVIDTGIFDHKDFKGKISAYNSFTKTGLTEQIDPIGHGSHVSGLIVGDRHKDKQIGVAPDSKLVVARAIERVSNLGSQEAVKKRVHAFASKILEAMQWMLDPDQDPQTDDFPKVINNSWGFPSSMPLSKSFFDGAIAKWRELGIIPVFAAGNAGKQGENSILFPGNSSEVITIGALKGSEIASFSSIGSDSLQKPDFVMQGYRAYSLMRKRNGQIDYGYQSGTSMAAPKFSAMVALMLQLDPFLKFDEIYSLIQNSSQDLGNEGYDSVYGWGNPNMLEVIQQVKDGLREKLISGTKSSLKYYSFYKANEKDLNNAEENIKLLERSFENFIKKVIKEQKLFLLNSWEVELNKQALLHPKHYKKLKSSFHRIKKFSDIFSD
ncbi:MAG: S8 family serine peptidase [Candidatus Cloacimonetes bacterium]|nr:S8 family serine peptidase [Candidatus Cloacimonadota bacterium]